MAIILVLFFIFRMRQCADSISRLYLTIYKSRLSKFTSKQAIYLFGFSLLYALLVIEFLSLTLTLTLSSLTLLPSSPLTAYMDLHLLFIFVKCFVKSKCAIVNEPKSRLFFVRQKQTNKIFMIFQHGKFFSVFITQKQRLLLKIHKNSAEVWTSLQ